MYERMHGCQRDDKDLCVCVCRAIVRRQVMFSICNSLAKLHVTCVIEMYRSIT